MCVCAHTCACVAGLGGLRKRTPRKSLMTSLLSLPEERMFVNAADTIACQSFMFSASSIMRQITMYLFPDSESQLKKEKTLRNSLAVQWSGLCGLTARALGSIPKSGN